jgi:UDP:flavonoid glycosyltransferase YjiC (YdhE family)
VLIPQGADNFTNAARCERVGVGSALRPGTVSADAVGSTLARVLDDPAFRRNAGLVAGEIRAMPEPGEVVRRLVDLVSQKERRPHSGKE